MHSRPENAWSIVEIAVGLDVDDEPVPRLRGQRGTHRRRCAVTHTAGPLASQVAVWLVVIPQLSVMRTGESAGRREAPVFLPDQRPELRVNPRGANGRGITTGLLDLDCFSEGCYMRVVIGAGVRVCALLDPGFLIRGQLALHFINDEWQAGLGIRLNRRGCFLTAWTSAKGSAG